MKERRQTLGLRGRGNANNANDSTRYVNSNNLASNCNANTGGSAKVKKNRSVVAARSAEHLRQDSNKKRLSAKADEMPLMPALKALE